MTQEERQLLLKDLCARLPYGVKLHIPSFSDTPQRLQQISDYETVKINDYVSPIDIDGVKPYLRSIHKLTNKELEELEFLTDSDYVDYCNEHHIDYHNLIPKGLAFEAPEGMYKNF